MKRPKTAAVIYDINFMGCFFVIRNISSPVQLSLLVLLEQWGFYAYHWKTPTRIFSNALCQCICPSPNVRIRDWNKATCISGVKVVPLVGSHEGGGAGIGGEERVNGPQHMQGLVHRLPERILGQGEVKHY